MARVIVGDQLLPVIVVFIGNKMDICIVSDVYNFFVGDKNITITGEEADELTADIQHLTPQDLEEKWLAVAQEFLSSLE